MAVDGRLHRQDLVQLDLVALEGDPPARHGETPDLRGALTGLPDALVPAGHEVLAPRLASQCVVLAELLLVPDLEADVLHLGGDAAGVRQLSIGEHVAVDERRVSGLTPKYGEAVDRDSARERLAARLEAEPYKAIVAFW